jgi:hypothetical protein
LHSIHFCHRLGEANSRLFIKTKQVALLLFLEQQLVIVKHPVETVIDFLDVLKKGFWIIE